MFAMVAIGLCIFGESGLVSEISKSLGRKIGLYLRDSF